MTSASSNSLFTLLIPLVRMIGPLISKALGAFLPPFCSVQIRNIYCKSNIYIMVLSVIKSMSQPRSGGCSETLRLKWVSLSGSNGAAGENISSMVDADPAALALLKVSSANTLSCVYNLFKQI